MTDKVNKGVGHFSTKFWFVQKFHKKRTIRTFLTKTVVGNSIHKLNSQLVNLENFNKLL